MQASAPTQIAPKTMLPDLLRQAPQVRPVLDRYGLRGCGGEHGPAETIAFFARAHEVPLNKLLAELRQAAANTNATDDGEVKASLADTIYQPFFKAGIALVLTLGAAWGALLLLKIGFLHSFTAVGIHEVNAHGHAQIFGWVGLFVMGFAYQAFPRFKHTSLAWPRLARATLVMMVSGILLRSLSEALLGVAGKRMVYTGLMGGALEMLAIGLFIAILLKTLRGSGKPLAFFDYYILSALAWFFVQAVYCSVYFYFTATAPSREALLSLVSTWQAPLRDVQIHGFAMLMILGVSQRMFHNFYGLPAPSPRKSLVCLVALNLAVIGESLGFVLMRVLGHQWVGLWYGAVILMTVAAATLVLDWRLYQKPAETDRSLKFLRTAYLWLFISLAMLVLLPVHQFGLLAQFAPESNAAQIGFSHAYYGAIRHAITVGFISLMIVGVSAKVVPTLMGVDLRALPALWPSYVLLNLGCFLRVFFQLFTDFSENAFPIAGVSGILEVTALALWGTHLWQLMAGRVRGQNTAPMPAIAAGQPILATHRVGAVLDTYPGLLPVFLDFGFKPLANPVLRRTVARQVTLERAARLMDVDLARLLATLNDARQTAPTTNHVMREQWEAARM